MKKEETFLYKVLLTSNQNKTAMSVLKALGVERGNSYLVQKIDFGNGKMEELGQDKIIPKSNLMVISPSFGVNETSYAVWCLEEQISKAKELCIDKMELKLRNNVQSAIKMSEVFQEYKEENK